jgi:hypothetical protein
VLTLTSGDVLRCGEATEGLPRKRARIGAGGDSPVRISAQDVSAVLVSLWSAFMERQSDGRTCVSLPTPFEVLPGDPPSAALCSDPDLSLLPGSSFSVVVITISACLNASFAVCSHTGTVTDPSR